MKLDGVSPDSSDCTCSHLLAPGHTWSHLQRPPPPSQHPHFTLGKIHHPFSLLTWLPSPLPPRAAHTSSPVNHHHGPWGEVYDPTAAQNNLSTMPERPGKGRCLDLLSASFLECWDRTQGLVHLSTTLPLSICVCTHAWECTACTSMVYMWRPEDNL